MITAGRVLRSLRGRNSFGAGVAFGLRGSLAGRDDRPRRPLAGPSTSAAVVVADSALVGVEGEGLNGVGPTGIGATGGRESENVPGASTGGTNAAGADGAVATERGSSSTTGSVGLAAGVGGVVVTAGTVTAGGAVGRGGRGIASNGELGDMGLTAERRGAA